MSRADRVAAQRRRSKQTTQPITLQSPYGGLNTRDAIDAMAITDAIQLDNFFPSEGKVSVRPGYVEHSKNLVLVYGGSSTLTIIDGLIDSGTDFTTNGTSVGDLILNTDTNVSTTVTGIISANQITTAISFISSGENYQILSDTGISAVETVAEYQSGATRHLIAAANNYLYNASDSGFSVDISDSGAPYANNRWQWANFNGVIQFVNGADAPRQWDGATMTLPAWTGTTVSQLVGVAVFKTRMFFWKANSADFWYGASNAISGVLTNFPLSRVDKSGGYLVAFESYTIDSGLGADDFAVFIMSSGAVIVYKGTDPASASTWALVGIYSIPEPLNIRGSCRVGADVMIVTAEDIVPLTTVLRGGFLGSGSKISGAVGASARTNAASFGWQIILHPAGRMLIINNPTSLGYDQWALNTITGAWARFKDIKASCWGTYNKKMYFGGDAGVVYKFDESISTDNGNAIDVVAVQAWSDLGSPYEKRIAACRPVISSDGGISYSLDIGFDFVTPLPASPTSVTTSGAPWDTTAWDTSPWSPENIVYASWSLCSGKGQMVSTSLRLSAKQDISWLRTDYRIETAKKL